MSKEVVSIDVALGVRDVLRDLVDPAELSTIDSAEVRPDPHHDGVYAVIGANESDRPDFIVYLAGFADAWGNVRTEDDFEQGKLR